MRQQLVDTAGWMGVRVTDAFSRLLEAVGSEDMPNEVEARWRLVETAWRLQIGSSMLATYDEGSGALLLPKQTAPTHSGHVLPRRAERLFAGQVLLLLGTDFHGRSRDARGR